MENWIDRETEGELAEQLLVFYFRLRSSLITAQVKQSAELLEQDVPQLLSLRRIWQELELSPPIAEESAAPSYAPPISGACSIQSAACSWSA